MFVVDERSRKFKTSKINKNIQMLKIGVLGAGHLGKVHLKLLNESPNFNLVGYFDPHENRN